MHWKYGLSFLYILSGRISFKGVGWNSLYCNTSPQSVTAQRARRCRIRSRIELIGELPPGEPGSCSCSQSSALVLAIEGYFLLTLAETGEALVLTLSETGLTFAETYSQSRPARSRVSSTAPAAFCLAGSPAQPATKSSTRRLARRPEGMSLDATGSSLPFPSTVNRARSKP
jgi:hypothetical protein